MTNEQDKENADSTRGYLEAVGRSEYNPGFYDKYIKRGIAIILSFDSLILLSPIYAVVAITIFTENPGPVLFTQKRIGQDKKYFNTT